MTLIEKIISLNQGRLVKAGETVWLKPDAVTARDFAGPNAALKFDAEFPDEPVFDAERIYFTFDCGHDLEYTKNQDLLREFCTGKRIGNIYEIDHGIGTLSLIERQVALPGRIITGTDSHFGILGAVGALGLSLGDTQTAFALKTGLVEFTIPQSIKVIITGSIEYPVSAKDITLKVVSTLGAKGALGKAIEFTGESVIAMNTPSRITLASMGAEMSAVTVLMTPNAQQMAQFEAKAGRKLKALIADDDAEYSDIFEIDVSDLKPLVSLPGDPRDVVAVDEVRGTRINQALIGSCTNSTYEDIKRVATLLSEHTVHPSVRAFIVPGTIETMQRIAQEGILQRLLDAGFIVYPPSCAGCTSEQVGKLGQNTVAIDTGNRNFAEKQGPGVKYLASPETVIASAIAGHITDPIGQGIQCPDTSLWEMKGSALEADHVLKIDHLDTAVQPSLQVDIPFEKPSLLRGRVWLIGDGERLFDDVDTDAIYHNLRLQETDPAKMGQYTFERFTRYPRYGEFARLCKPGDIVIAGDNFGAGSSREHAVKCFMSLGVGAIVARSFAPIYLGNAEALGFPLIINRQVGYDKLNDGDIITLDLNTGCISNQAKGIELKDGVGLSENFMLKYQAGGLFSLARRIKNQEA